MIPALYILYALVQAILVARYLLQEKDYPVVIVIIMTLLAPIVSILLAGAAFFEAIKWLVTYRSPGK